jgi:hypothetical protein
MASKRHKRAPAKKKQVRTKRKQAPASEDARSLVEFERASRIAEMKANCVVCALPEEVREQLRQSRKLGGNYVPRPIILKWLNEELGYKITEQDLQTHAAGRHDFR